MELVVNSDSNADLDIFIDFLYEGLEGFVYLAARNPKLKPEDPNYWVQEFFSYPDDRTKLTNVILAAGKTHDIYIGPAIYKEQRATREFVKASNVVWADFDGNAPEWNDPNGEPSLIVQSSSDKHQHVYWRLQEPITDLDTLERINRNLTYNLQADSGGWSAAKVLRPPSTSNFKRINDGTINSVVLVRTNAIAYDYEVFDSLAPAPDKVDTTFDLTGLPDVQDIILKYPFPEDMVRLFKKDKPGDRSTALMNLAYGCAEMGMEDKEIFVILLLADDKWLKFKERADRHQRLAQIISIARSKHPDSNQPEEEAFAVAFDFQSFLNTEINIDWVVEPMLMEQGAMLMVGPSGIGKTQISLRFMIHLALGIDFLHYKIKTPQRIVFLSLEMDHGSLKQFLLKMAIGMTDNQRSLLAENFIIVPHGEPWALNTPVGQEYLVNMIEAIRPQGLFIDSIGSAIKGAISSDEAVQPYLDFMDRLRKKYKLFTWAIHHMRKAQQGSHGATTQDDIYGNQYLLNRSTSAYGVLHGKNGLIKIRNFKNRLAATEHDYLIERIDNLGFIKYNKEDTALTQFVNKQIEDEPTGPVPDKAPNNFDL